MTDCTNLPAAMLARSKPTVRRLPGERHEFREMVPSSAPSATRDLTPPQHLDASGAITSSRTHEVQHGDPLQLHIKELEAEVATLRKKLEAYDG